MATGHESLDTDTTEKMAPQARSLSDRGNGQSRQGAAERCADCGDLAEGEKRPGFSGARLCDSAVSTTRPLSRRTADQLTALAAGTIWPLKSAGVPGRSPVNKILPSTA